MTRTLWFSVKVAVLVAIAWYLAEKQPGQVSLVWQDYRVDTSVGILLLAAGLVAVLAAILYRSWSGIKRTPGTIGRKLKANRQTRGYRALTQGMVAVAAGEREEAARWARKAGALLDEPPLTMLLSAQAAQLSGDDAAARPTARRPCGPSAGPRPPRRRRPRPCPGSAPDSRASDGSP